MAFPVHQIAYTYRTDPRVPAFPDDCPIIVYDGDCALCSRWVQFVLRHDRRQRYRFLSAQSPAGAALFVHYGLFTTDYLSFILIEDGLATVRAESTMRMLTGLGMPWSVVNVLRVVPRQWLDRAYDYIARNRIRWFGRPEHCLLPAPGQASRFLA